MVEDDARLFAGVEYFSGDAHVRREADAWREVTPEERLATTLGLAGVAAHQLAIKSDEIRARAEEPDPLPADALAILAELRRHGRD